MPDTPTPTTPSADKATEQSCQEYLQNQELPPRALRVFITVTLTALLVGIAVASYFLKDIWNLIIQHPAPLICVPYGAGVSFVIVLVLRSSFGPVEFKVWTMDFKGASGPVVLWVFCFLAMMLGYYMMWKVDGSVPAGALPIP